LGSGAIPQFIVSGSVRNHVKVVLTGHGGDELFAGYPVYKAAYIREHGLNWQGLQCACSGGIDESMRMFYFLFGGLADPILGRGQFRMFSAPGLRAFAAPLLAEVIDRHKNIGGLFSSMQPFAPSLGVDGVTRWYIATYLTTLLTQEDKISMAHGLEARVPICSKSLVNFALSLSGSLKLFEGRLKAVPRRAVRTILPPEIHVLPKRGFPTPIVEWLSRGGLSSEWEASWGGFLPGALRGLLDPRGVMNEFVSFRKFGHRLPHAYAAAHRLVSLQMLIGCASALEGIDSVKSLSGKYAENELPGYLLLKSNDNLHRASVGGYDGN
jgi:asparagine synthase (glutamine-hydrolysing)